MLDFNVIIRITALWIGNTAIHFSGIVFYGPDFLQNFKLCVACSAYYHDYYYKVPIAGAEIVSLKILDAYITYTYILVTDNCESNNIKIMITAYLVFLLVGAIFTTFIRFYSLR